jgi:hypothetical protein
MGDGILDRPYDEGNKTACWLSQAEVPHDPRRLVGRRIEQVNSGSICFKEAEGACDQSGDGPQSRSLLADLWRTDRGRPRVASRLFGSVA